MADVKNFGLKGISNDVQLGKGGGRFKWVSASDRYEFTGSDGSTLKAIRAANVDVQGTLLSDDITASSVSVNGDAVITGNLTVNGATTTVSSTNTTIEDSLLELATGTTGAPANDVGVIIERGNSDNVFIGWDESEDKVKVGTGAFTGASTGSLTIAVADFEAKEVKGTSLTDGTLSIASGSISSGVAATFSGAVQGGSLTDGTATISSGAISGLTTIGASGLATVGSLTDGTATLSGGSVTGAVNITASGTVQFGSLADGSITITAFVDEDNMASNSATLIPTQQSVKAYVDASNTALKAYVDGLDIDDDLGIAGDSGTGTVNMDSQSLTISGDTGITTTASGQSISVDLDDTAVTPGAYGNATAIPTFTVDQQGRLTAAGTAAISTSFTLTGDSGSNQVVAGGDTLDIAGGTNINTVVGNTDTLTVNLDSAISLTSVTASGNVSADNVIVGTGSGGSISGATTINASGAITGGSFTDGTATLNGGSLTGAVNVTASGTVSFGTLTDSGESIAVTKFVDESDGIGNNDNDTTIPTSAAVKDYVDNNAGDGQLLRASFTANSSDSTFNIGTVPNVSGRTYYASRVILDVTTLVAGGSVDGMVVKDNAGSGNTLAAATANDVSVGTYVVDLPYSSALTKNAAIQVEFVQSDGSTAATPTAGVVVGVVEYKFV